MIEVRLEDDEARELYETLSRQFCTGVVERFATQLCERLRGQKEAHEEDPINPGHYKGGIECIDALRSALGPEGYKGFCQGNAIKYLWRYASKGKAVEDLQKSEWYSDRLKMELQE